MCQSTFFLILRVYADDKHFDSCSCAANKNERDEYKSLYAEL